MMIGDTFEIWAGEGGGGGLNKKLQNKILKN